MTEEEIERILSDWIDIDLLAKALEEIPRNKVFSMRLLIAITQTSPKLKITELWQLLALAGIVTEDQTDILEQTDNLGNSPLHYLAWSGDLNALKKFIETRIKDQSIHEGFFSILNRQGMSPLHYAAWSGNFELFHFVYAKNPLALFTTNKLGETPVHYAALAGAARIVALILEKNPDKVFSKGCNDNTLAHYAARSGDCETLDTVLKNHQDPNAALLEKNKNGTSPSFLGLQSGRIDMLELLLRMDPTVLESVNDRGEGPACFAALSGSNHMLKFIFRQKPELEVNAKAAENNFVQACILSGNDRLVRQYVGIPTDDIVCFAAQVGHFGIFKELFGKSPTKESPFIIKLLETAVTEDNIAIIKYIMNHYKTTLLEKERVKLEKLLMLAISTGKIETFNYLLSQTEQNTLDISEFNQDEQAVIYLNLAKALKTCFSLCDLNFSEKFPFDYSKKMIIDGESYFAALLAKQVFNLLERNRSIFKPPKMKNLIARGANCDHERTQFLQDCLTIGLPYWAEKLNIRDHSLLDSPYALADKILSHNKRCLWPALHHEIRTWDALSQAWFSKDFPSELKEYVAYRVHLGIPPGKLHSFTSKYHASSQKFFPHAPADARLEPRKIFPDDGGGLNHTDPLAEGDEFVDVVKNDSPK